MKQFFRKIFFRDEPAKGAFYHATAALTVPWMLSALFCFLLPPILTLPPSNPAIWIEVVLFCSIPIVACLEIVMTAVCLIRLKCMRVKNREDARVVKSTRWMGWSVVLFVLMAIAVVWMQGEYWTAGIVPALPLLLAGYGCLGCFLGCCQGIGFKGVVTKSALRLWCVVAVIWVVSVCMAVVAKSAANRHCADLERRFGRPPTDEARDAWIAEDCLIDADFWRKVGEILQRREKPKTGFIKEDDSENDEEDSEDNDYVDDIWEFFPNETKNISAKLNNIYRKQLADFTELPELEKMFDGTVPQLLRKDFIWFKVGDAIHVIFRMEMWRLYFALADKDMDMVMSVLHRMDNILECVRQMEKHNFFNGNWSYDSRWLYVMNEIIASRLPTDEQLFIMKEMLEKREAAYKDIMDGDVYFLVLRFAEEFQPVDSVFHLEGESLPTSYSLYRLIGIVDGSYWEVKSWIRKLQIITGHIFIPHLWWFSANEQRTIFKMMKHYPDIVPEWHSGSMVLAMDLHYDWVCNMAFFYKRNLVINRALRCVIDAVLEQRRTGEYPASLPSIPDDPFTGNPLKYRVGNCLQFDYEKQRPFPMQAIQVWSCGYNKKDDDGVFFDLPEDEKRKNYCRDDIRVLIPIEQSK